MAYDKRKIAKSFHLPRYPYLTGVASLLDFRGSRTRRLGEQILSRSAAEAMRADWEAVGESLWWAIGQHEKNAIEESLSG